MTSKVLTARRKIIDMTGGPGSNSTGDQAEDGSTSMLQLEHLLESSAITEYDDSHQQGSQAPQQRKNSWPRKSLLTLRDAFRGSRSLDRTSNASKTSDDRTHSGMCYVSLQDLNPPQQTGVSSWLRRAASTKFHRHRRSSVSTASSIPVPAPAPYMPGAYPPHSEVDTEPVISPRNVTGGAAARAAAAAQNEGLASASSSTLWDNSPTSRDYPHRSQSNTRLSARSLTTLRDNLRLVEPKVNNDTESGIGIDVRDRFDDMEIMTTVTRNDPNRVLPEELFAHVLSYLDAVSLMKAELVSIRWHGTASSYHTWRHVFWREYGLQSSSYTDGVQVSQVGGLGLGKKRPDQDWKTMWKVRKNLEDRWQNAQAAAIYLEGHKDSVYCVQFDEHKILTGSRDRTIRIWDAHTYDCIKLLGVPKTTLPARPQEDERMVRNTRGQKPTASIIPARPLVELVPTQRPELYHLGSILCLQYDDEIMVTGSSDYTCIMWDVQDDYKPFRQLSFHKAGVLDVCFDDKHIVSCSKDTNICLWDRDTGDLLRTLSGHRGPVNAVQLRGNLIVSASGDGIAKLWNLTSGLCIKEFPSRDRGMACVEFSPDSRTILAGGNDQVIYHFDANSGELIRELKGHKGLVRSLHIDSVNDRVISGSYDHSVKAYDLITGNMICDFDGWTTSWMLSAKADYRRIIATSQDGQAVIMDFGHQLPGIELLEG